MIPRVLFFAVAGAWILFAQQPTGSRTAFESPDKLQNTANPFRYYVTRPGPGGTEERVPLPTVFASQSIAYLNVESAVDGRLVVFVTDGKAAPQPFYQGKELIHQGERARIPVRFDDKPGETQFIVAVVTGDLAKDTKPLPFLKIEDYIKSGGKGVSLVEEPPVTQAGPVIWTKFSLRNQ